AAARRGVGVGGREVAAPQQPGDGLGILAVALALAAVDRFHGPGMAEDEGDGVITAGVGEPVPAVDTLAGDEQSLAEGRDGAQEGLGLGGEGAGEDDSAGAVEGDEGEGPGVQIDAGGGSGGGGGRESA